MQGRGQRAVIAGGGEGSSQLTVEKNIAILNRHVLDLVRNVSIGERQLNIRQDCEWQSKKSNSSRE